MAVGDAAAGVATATDAPAARLETPAEFAPAGDHAADVASGAATRDRSSLVFALALVLAALGWTATAVLAAAAALAGREVNVAVVASWISVGTGPLALIGVIALLWRRGGKSEQRRFALVAADLRAETAALDAALDRLSSRAADHRAVLAENATRLGALGEETSGRLIALGEEFRRGTGELTHAARALDGAAETTRSDIGVVMADLPLAEAVAARLGETLRQTGEAVRDEVATLDARIAGVNERARAMEAALDAAAATLAGRVAELDEAGAAADRRLREGAGQVERAIDAGLARAADAFDRTRAGIDEQSAGLIALVDQSEAALGRVGADAAVALARQVASARGELDGLAAVLTTQDEATQLLLARLTAGLAEIEARSIALTDSGAARSAQLGQGLAAVRGEIEQLTGALAAGDLAAQAMNQRAEWLRAALDNAVTMIEQRLPVTFDRIEAEAEHSRTVAEAALPAVEALEARASAAGAAIDAAGVAARRQADSAAERIAPMEERIAALRDAAAALAGTMTETAGTAAAIVDETTPRLVDAMVRAREAGTLAAERTRAALAEIVPGSAAALAEAARHALADTLPAEVEAQMGAIAAAAERATAATRAANEALLRQLVTIAQTTAAVEQRIETARQQAEEDNSDALSRRVALLIESLNSIAIDVTKLLSNEVTDSAWASYLKGDRGVFTRRAVRLLDSGEAREITRHYENEPEFREHVNRYIHDFEAMLREVLAHRDGSPMAVTLLSSDMGKLYVALAQAIERLRT